MSVKYIIASNNAKKHIELERILSSLDIEITTAAEMGFEPIEPEENGASFAENAHIKAAAFAAHCGMPAIADDSGLCVDALGGAPGIFSARYAGEPSDSDKNISKLLFELRDVKGSERSAHFICSMCCIYPDGGEITAEGICEGYIADGRDGDGGFGYDPIFRLPDGRSFARITAQEKDEVSHRGKALRELAEKIAQKQH